MLCRPTIGREGFLILCIIALSLYTFRLHTESNNVFYNTQAPGSNRWTLQDRLKLSENFYAETLKRRKALIDAYPGDTIPLFAAVNAKTYRETPYSVWDLIPAAFNCPWDIQRVGRMGDGGKWVCGLARYENRKSEECVIYSFGVRDESSFEEEMLERTNCGVWAYDPAVAEFGPQLSKKYVEQGRAKFVQAALGPVTKVEGKISFYSLKKLMEMNGHDYIDFLKMDIEFAEFDSMTAFLEDFAGQKLPIGQFLVEIHLFKNKITTEKFLQWWEAFEQRGLRPVWTEPNLIYVTQHLADSMPRLAEYTLVNIDNNRNPLLFE